jgi:hypothetical protein
MINYLRLARALYRAVEGVREGNVKGIAGFFLFGVADPVSGIGGDCEKVFGWEKLVKVFGLFEFITDLALGDQRVPSHQLHELITGGLEGLNRLLFIMLD